MKKKVNAKKLKVNKEKVKELNDKELANVVGGAKATGIECGNGNTSGCASTLKCPTVTC